MNGNIDLITAIQLIKKDRSKESQFFEALYQAIVPICTVLFILSIGKTWSADISLCLCHPIKITSEDHPAARQIWIHPLPYSWLR